MGGNRKFYLEGIFLLGERNKEYEIRTKMEQEQWLQLRMLFLLGYNLKIVIWCKCVYVCLCLSVWEGIDFRWGGVGWGNNFLAGGRGTPSMSPPTPNRENSAIPETKLGHKTQRNYNRLNCNLYYKSVIIHKNRIFPYFQNKVKQLHKYNIIIIIIIIMIIK